MNGVFTFRALRSREASRATPQASRRRRGARCLLPALLLAALSSVHAQAPIEDRSAGGNRFVEAQQRVEFARKSAEQDVQRVREAETGFKQAEAEWKTAKKQERDARGRADAASRALAQARARAGQSRKAYREQSAQFERLRQQ